MKVKSFMQNQLNQNKPVHILLSWLVVVLWMGLIFYLSAQVADQSAKLSFGVTQFFINLLHTVFPGIHIDIQTLGFVVRKLAHFLCYLVLGLLVLNAFGKSGVKGYKRFLFSAIVCILYAASDEIHQLYVPGRGGQIRDVLIDSFGAGTGFILYIAIGKLHALKKERKNKVLPDNPESDRT